MILDYQHYIDLIKEYQNVDLEKTLKICNEALNIITNTTERYYFYYTKSKIYKTQSQFYKSIINIKRAIRCLGDKKLMEAISDNDVWFAYANWMLGQNYYELKKYNLSIKYNVIAYNFFKITGNKEYELDTLFNINLAKRSTNKCLEIINEIDSIICNNANYINEINQYYKELAFMIKDNYGIDYLKKFDNIINPEIINKLALESLIAL